MMAGPTTRFVEITTPHIRWSVWFVFIGGAGGLALFGKFVLPWAPFSTLPVVSAIGTGLLCTGIAMAYVRWRTILTVDADTVVQDHRPWPRGKVQFDISEIEKVTPADPREGDPAWARVEVALRGGRTVRMRTRRADALVKTLTESRATG